MYVWSPWFAKAAWRRRSDSVLYACCSLNQLASSASYDHSCPSSLSILSPAVFYWSRARMRIYASRPPYFASWSSCSCPWAYCRGRWTWQLMEDSFGQSWLYPLVCSKRWPLLPAFLGCSNGIYLRIQVQLGPYFWDCFSFSPSCA